MLTRRSPARPEGFFPSAWGGPGPLPKGESPLWIPRDKFEIAIGIASMHAAMHGANTRRKKSCRGREMWRRGWDSNPWCREAHTISSRAYSSALAPLRVKSPRVFGLLFCGGGESGIRTRDEINPILVFETSAFIRSAISPGQKNYSTEIISNRVESCLRKAGVFLSQDTFEGAHALIQITSQTLESILPYPNLGSMNSSMATARPSSSTDGAT